MRDKILGMIEDYGKWLQSPPVFRETYEMLLVGEGGCKGVCGEMGGESGRE